MDLFCGCENIKFEFRSKISNLIEYGVHLYLYLNLYFVFVFVLAFFALYGSPSPISQVALPPIERPKTQGSGKERRFAIAIGHTYMIV